MSRPDSAPQPTPIACTLDAESLESRTDEWREFVSSSVTAVETDDKTLRLVLRDSEAALLSAASLGAREKACCAFFDVDIEITADGRALRFSVPAGAEEALASFVALVRP
jgi:cell division protein ZapA (FtsZ GTPase activity inhibitor)